MAVGKTGGVAVAYSTAYRAVMVRFGVTSIAGNAFRTNGNGIEQAITSPASSSKTTILEKDLVLTFTSNQEKNTVCLPETGDPWKAVRVCRIVHMCLYRAA
jgi:hypothetical protein